MYSIDELAERIADLEARLEFQDETIARLNDELVVHQQRYFELNKKVAYLTDQLENKAADMADPKDEPPPPHY